MQNWPLTSTLTLKPIRFPPPPPDPQLDTFYKNWYLPKAFLDALVFTQEMTLLLPDKLKLFSHTLWRARMAFKDESIPRVVSCLLIS